MSKKKIMVLDVEGGFTTKPYNVGYLIADCHGNIDCKKSYALMDCIWENVESSKYLNPDNKGRKMCFKNIQEILRDNVKYKWVLTDEFFMDFIKDIENYGVSEIWAFNADFDRGSIQKRLFGFNVAKLMGVKWYDIMKSAVHNLCLSPKYLDFCLKNEFVTEKGNIKTSAESIYAYMSKNVDFEEEHTGLADCEIEYKLYLFARATKKKIFRESGNWFTVKTYRMAKGV